MLPTHALVGLALALPVAAVAPEYADIALAAGFIGGILPDMDMYVGHRKTLHYPVYYSALALVAAPIAALVPTAATIAAALVLVAAAVHSVMDVFGGGLELRPWEATSSRAVYDHHRGRWLAPRRWIRYDGAPEDLLLSVALAVPLLIALDGILDTVVGLSLLVAVVYAGVRRLLPKVAEAIVSGYLAGTLPERALAVLPARYGTERGE